MTALRFDGRVAIITGAGGVSGAPMRSRSHAAELRFSSTTWVERSTAADPRHRRQTASSMRSLPPVASHGRTIPAWLDGVVLIENTAEAISASLSLIDGIDVDRFLEPSSLDDETTIIAKALSATS